MSDELAALQAQFKQQEEEKQKRENGGTKNTDWYPFWDMEIDQTATVRFLKDGDPKSSYFLVEKWMHKLDVEVDGKSQKRFVPCLAHPAYGAEPCPICAQSQKFYDEKGDCFDEKMGSYFWRKKSWIANIIIIDSPFPYEGSPHKLINFESVTKIAESIKKAIMSGDLEAMPTDVKKGYNFRLNSIKDGKYASFTTSSFAPKQSAIPDELLEGVEPFNLTEKLPKKPSLEYVNAVLHSALTGDPFVWKSKGETNDGDDDHTDALSNKASSVAAKPVKAEIAKHDDSDNNDSAKATPTASVDKAASESVMDIIARRKQAKANK